MMRKPIKIDWEELESAFQTRREDLVYHLDLVTGQVVLEGEGEDLIEGDDDIDGDINTDAPRRNETTRLTIEPPGPQDEVVWMEDFVDEAENVDATVLDRLKVALAADDPLESFREVLRQNPTERDIWFLYRSDRIHEVIENWLEANGVRSTERPPWEA